MRCTGRLTTQVNSKASKAVRETWETRELRAKKHQNRFQINHRRQDLALSWALSVGPTKCGDYDVSLLSIPYRHKLQYSAGCGSRELLLSRKSPAMAAPDVHHLFHHPIADHSFSADKQTLAVARDTTVELYGRTGTGFKLKDELKGHDKTVTSVDIALNSGRIVTCSQGYYPTVLY